MLRNAALQAVLRLQSVMSTCYWHYAQAAQMRREVSMAAHASYAADMLKGCVQRWQQQATAVQDQVVSLCNIAWKAINVPDVQSSHTHQMQGQTCVILAHTCCCEVHILSQSQPCRAPKAASTDYFCIPGRGGSALAS